MLWKDLFPTREEYAARGGGFQTPPGGENPPPKGTQRMVHYRGQPHIFESSGKAGIMPRIIPVQRCPTCGQNIMPKPTPVPMNSGRGFERFATGTLPPGKLPFGGQLRRFL